MSVDMKFDISKLLFDEEHANLFFVWNDGTKIPAHKSIVFSAAPYFKWVNPVSLHHLAFVA